MKTRPEIFYFSTICKNKFAKREISHWIFQDTFSVLLLLVLLLSGRHVSAQQAQYPDSYLDSDPDPDFGSVTVPHDFGFGWETDNGDLTDTCPDLDLPLKKEQKYRQSTYLIDADEATTSDGVITIGFLSSYLSSKLTLGAVPLAVDAVNADPTLLPGRQLRFAAADIGNPRNDGMAALPIRRMTELRDDNATVAFIGPDGECAAEALVSTAWNIPMITYNCADSLDSNKQPFYTFARTLPPSSKISKSVISLLEKFHWNKLIIIVSKKAEWMQITEAVKKLAQRRSINVTDVIFIDDYIPSHFKKLESIAEQTYTKTRVYLFIGEHIALVDFVKSLDQLKILDSGDYIVISIDDFSYDPEINQTDQYITRNYLDPYLSTGGDLSQAFRSVLKVTPSHPRNPAYNETLNQIRHYSTKPPFCVPYYEEIFGTIEVPIYAAYAYDAVMIYARALTEALADGHDPRNGTAVLERIRNRSYNSILGFDVFIDHNGDAEGNYSVLAMIPQGQGQGQALTLQPVGYFENNVTEQSSNDYLPNFKYFDDSIPIHWVDGSPPIAEPPCGFDYEKCSRPDWKTILICAVSAIVLTVAAGLVVRHYRYEHKLACLLWKVDIREVIPIPLDPETGSTNSALPTHVVSRLSLLLPFGNNNNNLSRRNTPDFPLDLGIKRAYTRIGLYRGTVVAIKMITRKHIDVTQSVRKELKLIRELRHENVVPFIGASVDYGGVYVLTGYCARGSLQDVLRNRDFPLDTMFVASLVADLIRGMLFIHDSEIISHGNLKSSNCLVDSRWVLQITDFGIHELKGNLETYRNPHKADKFLWTAPELLRTANPPARGTQKADVFSFGIILFEIIGRSGPWGTAQIPPKEIVERVKHPEWFGHSIFRPPISQLKCPDYVLRCMQDCWHELPDLRPDFKNIRARLKEMEAGLKPNIFDNMISMMEKYAYNLEGLVQERTIQLMEEKKKTEALLHRMLPKSVAESLKRGEPVEAESFDSVSIYFSDIVGFTSLSASSTPLQVVELLNELYTLFDSIIENYDVYKVETIGDAYMVASGLPIRNGDRHASEVASMALHLLSEIRNFQIRHRPGETLKLRIGIHSGSCVAGVVGLKMPRYCLFGDTVNTASRMESSGEALRVHISAATKGLLDRLGGYIAEERGLIPIRGKGEMMTYWLKGEEPWRSKRRLSTLAVSKEHLNDHRINATIHRNDSKVLQEATAITDSLETTNPAMENYPNTKVADLEHSGENTWLLPQQDGDRNRPGANTWFLPQQLPRDSSELGCSASCEPEEKMDIENSTAETWLLQECKDEANKDFNGAQDLQLYNKTYELQPSDDSVSFPHYRTVSIVSDGSDVLSPVRTHPLLSQTCV